MRRERASLYVLIGILVAGSVVRILMMVAWQPAFMGWPDARSYLDVAHGQLFGNVLRPAGYPLFLRGLDGLGASLTFIVGLNHLLALGSAVLLYLAVTGAGAPAAAGLLPAAIVALNGDGVFIEHNPLSEPLFEFLVALALYCAVRSLHDKRLAWPALVGLIVAYATTVRVVGAPLLVVFAVWFLAQRRFTATAAAAGVVIAVFGAYTIAEVATTGKTGLSRHGGWHLYARVAGFADCSRFTPPAGTRVLCQRTPPGHRLTVDQYLFDVRSPASRAYQNPFAATDAQSDALGAFARQAILHQPLDYLREVGGDSLRYIAPDSMRSYGGGPSYADLVGRPILFERYFQDEGLKAIRLYYDPSRTGYTFYPGLLHDLLDYERLTRIQGALFVLLALLSLSGPLLLRGPPRAAAILFALTAWALLLVPVATLEFSARTAVPGFGALGAAAAAGLQGVLMPARARPLRWRRLTRTLARPGA